MPSFTCPFCGCATSVSQNNISTWSLNFYSSYNPERSDPFLKITIFRCPNESCRKETLFADGVNGYIDGNHVPIYPETVYKHFPEYIPQGIRQDYEESCLIRDKSPKASATLARRCLQGMIRDFWGFHGRTLNEEISQLQGRIPTSQWNAIDALRQMGNIGAHMEHDTNLIVDISPGEAANLLKLIELLMDKWYIARHEEQSLYADIASANSALQAQRSGI